MSKRLVKPESVPQSLWDKCSKAERKHIVRHEEQHRAVRRMMEQKQALWNAAGQYATHPFFGALAKSLNS